MRDFFLRFLVRSDCHLCDDARPIVVAVAAGSGVDVVEVDIADDDDLMNRFGLRVPVVLGPGDVVLAEGAIDDVRALRRAVRRFGR